MKKISHNTAVKNTILGLLAVSLVVLALVLNRGSDFKGTDSIAEEIVSEMRPGYTQWLQSLWKPPGGEVESLIFALQAALGSGFIGYYIGFKRGKSKRE